MREDVINYEYIANVRTGTKVRTLHGMFFLQSLQVRVIHLGKSLIISRNITCHLTLAFTI